MREILFKAKRKDNGEWVEGYYLNKIDPLLGVESSFILNQGDMCSFFSWHEVDPYTVCQCVGKKDKNGKYIFENDVVLYENKKKYKVVFEDYMFTCKRFYNPSYDAPGDAFSEGTECFEVIGTIHDKG